MWLLLNSPFSGVNIRYGLKNSFALINPDGCDNFTEIAGTHLEGYSNADIVSITPFSSGGGDVSPIVPRIICDTFYNLENINFFNIGVTKIDDASFSGCSKVTNIKFTLNRIRSISANAFANLPDLLYLDLETNSLTSLPENVFANQHNLMRLTLANNPFENIPTNLFGPLESLEQLSLQGTNIARINAKWFASNHNLDALSLNDNRITRHQVSMDWSD